MNRRAIAVLEVVAAMTVPGAAWAVQANTEELADAARWASAKFAAKQMPEPRGPSLEVLANNDPVQRNSRGGRPMAIAGKEYRRGLYCHAVSKVVVRLPGRAKRFAATVGVDNNEQTAGGRGSVVFSVSAGARVLFRTGVMREGMAGVPVSAILDGADELTLSIGDAGDGIACDQSDWADARVEMEDGRILWLGDFPFLGTQRPPTMDPPFSFVYGGKPSSELLAKWPVERRSEAIDDRRTRIVSEWKEPGGGLVARAEAVVYSDYPVVEWVVRFRNEGTAGAPLLEDVRSLDVTLQRDAEGEFVLHHATGSPYSATDYQPFTVTMTPGASKRITTSGGRPTNSDLPYFNVSWSVGGAIAVLGWPGQWAATFERDQAAGMRVCGGQELLRVKLHPGEEIRTPLSVLLFYRGDWVRSQNLWRRWMMDHNLPRPYGKPVQPDLAACSSHQFGEMIHADEASQILFIDRYLQEGIKLDYWWMDAGWYVNSGDWPNTGTWEVDKKRFPRGLRAITDHGRSKGVKSIVWFEPERVNPGTWLYTERPQWLLGKGDGDRLLNLGNPEALSWLIDHVDGLIRSEGIDLYRNDFNIDPLGFWRDADEPDRQGMTEMRYVEGFLAYWDALRQRHPNMLIDTCASGGRRNDVETLRRSVPLLRSDFILQPEAQQNHTYGISFWIPFHGTGFNSMDPYAVRSQMAPHGTACYDMRRKDVSYREAVRLVKQRAEVIGLMLKDYYPLTAYSAGDDAWMAWQYDDPEKGEGMVQAFRRPGSAFEAARFPLQGVDASAKYSVWDMDAPRSRRTMTGAALMENGMRVVIEKRPGAVILRYRRVETKPAAK